MQAQNTLLNNRIISSLSEATNPHIHPIELVQLMPIASPPHRGGGEPPNKQWDEQKESWAFLYLEQAGKEGRLRVF